LDRVISNNVLTLPPVDRDNLRDRLVIIAPQAAPINTRALCFHRPTQAQIRKDAILAEPILELLVCYDL